MFANREAIEMLVRGDSTASDAEKSSVLGMMSGGGVAVSAKPEGERLVVSFEEAARMLGYRSLRGVYKAVGDGVLKAYYGGKSARRATGVLMSSIRQVTGSDVRV